MTASPRLLCTILSAAALFGLNACANARTGESPAAFDPEPGQPVVVQLYDCDGVAQHGINDPKIVEDGGQMTFSITGRGLVYFTITTELEAREPGTPSRNAKARTMHFVLGTYESGVGAKARIKGRANEDDAEASLVQVDRGWLWASSTPPPAWVDASTPPGEPEAFTDVGEPQVPVLRPAVGWSIFTLLRSRYTWAGADASRYIVRIEDPGTRREGAVVYNLDPESNAYHADEPKNRTTIATDMHARSEGRSPIGTPTGTEGDDKTFVTYATRRVGLIQRHPKVGQPECGDHHKRASRQD